MNKYIVEQCKKEYPSCETIFDRFYYKIDKLGDIEKISFWFDQEFNCPMYCLCDGKHMMWYGDHGSFTFDCTWRTSLMKIPFQSPHYLFEKLDKSGARGTGLIWNPDVAKKAVLERIYESSWWEEEIESEFIRSQIKELFEGPAYKDSFYYETGDQDDEMLDAIKDLINATENESLFAAKLNEMKDDWPISSDDYDLYDCGNEISYHFWFILMCLNWIYDKEIEKENNKINEVGIFDVCM